jgi:hypothetical protein
MPCSDPTAAIRTMTTRSRMSKEDVAAAAT